MFDNQHVPLVRGVPCAKTERVDVGYMRLPIGTATHSLVCVIPIPRISFAHISSFAVAQDDKKGGCRKTATSRCYPDAGPPAQLQAKEFDIIPNYIMFGKKNFPDTN